MVIITIVHTNASANKHTPLHAEGEEVKKTEGVNHTFIRCLIVRQEQELLYCVLSQENWLTSVISLSFFPSLSLSFFLSMYVHPTGALLHTSFSRGLCLREKREQSQHSLCHSRLVADSELAVPMEEKITNG